MAEKSEFLTLARIVDKVKEAYRKELEKQGVEGACYPIRITVWVTSEAEHFRPVKKLIEIDEREIEREGEVEK